MIKMTMAAEPSVKLIIPGLGEGVKCSDYGPGCVGAHTISLLRLQMIVVEYDNEENALKDAKRLNGYYTHNWFFDDVTGEPVLEKFVQQTYNAVNPNVTPTPTTTAVASPGAP